MTLKRFFTLAAIAGLAAALGGCSLLSSEPGRDADSQITEAGNIGADAFQVGDCMISADLEQTFTEVPAVPCSQAHDAEVISLVTVMSSSEYDEAAITAEADTACLEDMATYVGANWETVENGNLVVNYFYPTSGSWDAGDRTITCVAVDGSGELSLTSSVKGIGA